MFFNILRQQPNGLVFHVLVPKLVTAIQTFVLLVFFSGLAMVFLPFFTDIKAFGIHTGDNPFPCVIAGFALIFFSKIMELAAKLLAQMEITYIFDRLTQEVHIQSRAKSLLPYYQKPIPFSTIQSFKLKRVLVKGRVSRFMLEFIQHDGTFYPITSFKSELKALSVIKAFQQFIPVPLSEESIEDIRLVDYKAAFANQFNAPPELIEDKPQPD